MSTLDPTLPIFHLLTPKSTPLDTTFSLSVSSSHPQPRYLKRRDPLPANTYSIALLDAYHPSIIYATVVLPSLPPSSSSDEPRIPSLIPIHLHNPSSKIVLQHKKPRWPTGTPYFEFRLPKTSFLQPTASRLDRELSGQQENPDMEYATFRWRKEGGVLSKPSLRCSLIHPNNLPLQDDGLGAYRRGSGTESSGGDPDTTVAIFTNGLGGKRQKGEVTIYESNLARVDVEDVKGLELALVLGAAVIADVWFGDTRTLFNLSSCPEGFRGPGRVKTTRLEELDTEEGRRVLEGLQPERGIEERRRAVGPNGYPVDRKEAIEMPTAMSPPPPPTFEEAIASSSRRPPVGQASSSSSATGPSRQPPQRHTHTHNHTNHPQQLQPARQPPPSRQPPPRQPPPQPKPDLAAQELAARKLQQQFEAEAREEQARIDRETERLRREYERELLSQSEPAPPPQPPRPSSRPSGGGRRELRTVGSQPLRNGNGVGSGGSGGGRGRLASIPQGQQATVNSPPTSPVNSGAHQHRRWFSTDNTPTTASQPTNAYGSSNLGPPPGKSMQRKSFLGLRMFGKDKPAEPMQSVPESGRMPAPSHPAQPTRVQGGRPPVVNGGVEAPSGNGRVLVKKKRSGFW